MTQETLKVSFSDAPLHGAGTVSFDPAQRPKLMRPHWLLVETCTSVARSCFKEKEMKMLKASAIATAVSFALATGAQGAAYVDLPIANAKDHAFDAADTLYVTAGNKLYRYDTSRCKLGSQTLGTSLMGVDVSADDRYVAVADQAVSGGKVHVYLFDRGPSGSQWTLEYPAAFMENGSYMVAWTGDNSLLISGTFAGSGWVPLRRYQPENGTLATVGQVRQNTMLTASDYSNTVAVAEANISSGPVHLWDNYLRAYTANRDLNWFTFDVGVTVFGDRVIAPTYNGAFVLARDARSSVMSIQGIIGQYATWGPLSGTFSPMGTQIVTADWAWTYSGVSSGIRIYDANTLQLIKRVDNFALDWNGNQALTAGRVTLSRDANWLAVTLSDRVRLYDVSDEPIDRLYDTTVGLEPQRCATMPTNTQNTVQAVRRATPQFDEQGWAPGGRPSGE